MKNRFIFLLLIMTSFVYSNYTDHYETTFTLTNIEKPFVIVIASYNNANWYLQNLDSVFFQNYSNYRVIYIDDVSSDGTSVLVENYIQKNKLTSKIILIKNKERVGALANIYKAIHLCLPKEIIIILDGDDWLANNNVLNRLNQEYSDSEVWLTYGQFAFYFEKNSSLKEGISSKIPDHVIAANSIRQDGEGSTPSHLRSFYAKLFHQIKKEDLLYNCNFFRTACDVAIMLPMIEMAGFHTRFISDLLYIYNRATPLNSDKINWRLQLEMDQEIRSRKNYEPLDSLFIEENRSCIIGQLPHA